MDNKVIEKVTEIANAIESMWNKKNIGIEIKFVILEFTKDGITGHVNGNFQPLFESERENLGYLKVRKGDDDWEIIEPTNYRRVRDDDIPENWKRNLKFRDGRGDGVKITPKKSC